MLMNMGFIIEAGSWIGDSEDGVFAYLFSQKAFVDSVDIYCISPVEE